MKEGIMGMESGKIQLNFGKLYDHANKISNVQTPTPLDHLLFTLYDLISKSYLLLSKDADPFSKQIINHR